MSDTPGTLEDQLRTLHRMYSIGGTTLEEAADEIASLRARVEVLVDLLARYRNETPLGHQPHMIAHVADAAILAARQALKDTPDE